MRPSPEPSVVLRELGAASVRPRLEEHKIFTVGSAPSLDCTGLPAGWGSIKIRQRRAPLRQA